MLQYEKVIHSISSMIQEGLLLEGEQIPSLRRMSEQAGVSLNSVREAYTRLEQLFFIEAKPQSGYFVRPLSRELKAVPAREPGTMNPNEVGLCRIFNACQEKEDITPGTALGIATLDPSFYPVQEMGRILKDIIQQDSARMFEYMVPPGYQPLREQLARLALEGGVSVSPEDIVITNGCHEGLYLILSALCKKGDTIALESPFYFNLLRMLEKLGLKVLEIPSAPDQGMPLETLEFILEQYKISAVITSSNFSNPLGFSHDKKKKIALLNLLQQYKVPLVEDDIYSELFFSAKRPPSYFHLAKEDQEVYLCSSFSKTLGPGLRIGWVWPGRLKEAVIEHKTLLNLGASSLDQMAIARFLKGGYFHRHMRKLRKLLAGNVSSMRKSLLEHFPAGTRVTNPSGGMILWICLPGEVDTMELYHKAMEKGILIAPGSLFSLTRDFSSCFRINAGYLPEDPTSLVQELAACIPDQPLS